MTSIKYERQENYLQTASSYVTHKEAGIISAQGVFMQYGGRSFGGARLFWGAERTRFA